MSFAAMKAHIIKQFTIEKIPPLVKGFMDPPPSLLPINLL